MRASRTITIGVICLIYVGVRVWGLSASCLWFDEIFSVHAAEHSWNSVLSFVALDLIHPPLFYVLLKLWIGVGGESLLWLRLLPVILSVLAIFPFLSLCRELKIGRWASVFALFLLSVNGSLIKYAQEVRMYSTLMCLSLFSMWLFARYFNKGKNLIPLVIVNVLMVYTHYFGWFVVLSEVVLIVWLQRVKWRAIVAMFAITFAAFLPWMTAVLAAARSGSGLAQNIGWMTKPGLRQMATFFFNLVEPSYFQASSGEPFSRFLISIPLLIVIIAGTAFFFLMTRNAEGGEPQGKRLLLTFILVPVIMAFIASWVLPYSIWGTRHLTIVFAPVCILTAVFLTPNGIRGLRIALCGTIVLLSGIAFALQVAQETPMYSWCAWEPLAAHAVTVDQNIPVVAFEDLSAYHLWFALREGKANIVKIDSLEGVAEDRAYFLPRGFDSVRRVELGEVNDRRLWIAYRSRTISESEPPLRNFLVKGYNIIDRRVVEAGSEQVAMILLEK